MHTLFGLSLLLEKPLKSRDGYLTFRISGKDILIAPLTLINPIIEENLGDVIDIVTGKNVELIFGKRITRYFKVGRIPTLNIKFSFDKYHSGEYRKDYWYRFPIPIRIDDKESIDFEVRFVRKRVYRDNMRFPKIGIELIEGY